MILPSLRSPLHCLQSAAVTHLKQGLPGNYYPGRAGEFPKATRLGLACGEAAIPLQRKGIESEGEQVKDVLVIFTDNRLFLLQAVAPKTAPGTRAEEKFSSWHFNMLDSKKNEFLNFGHIKTRKLPLQHLQNNNTLVFCGLRKTYFVYFCRKRLQL